MPETTKYISTEIIIRTNLDCNHLIKFFEERDDPVQKFPCDKDYKWHFVIAPLPRENADLDVRDLCGEIESLPEIAKREWEDSGFKEFFIGYHASNHFNVFTEQLSNETLCSVSKVGAGIGIVVYAGADDEE